jgi:hypothetical protein
MINVLDTKVDHMVPAGEFVWLTVGRYSVRLDAGSAGECRVKVYKLNEEDGDHLLNEEFEQ